MYRYTLFSGGLLKHQLQTLDTLEEDIAAHFDELFSQVSSKITKICQLDKEIWKKLDILLVESEEKAQLVDYLRDEQVSNFYSKQ